MCNAERKVQTTHLTKFKIKGEHRLGVFENRVLRRIFGPKREKVTGDWRKLIRYSNIYRRLLLVGFLLVLYFDPEDGDSTFLRNVC
jgi:hypothetical protein